MEKKRTFSFDSHQRLKKMLLLLKVSLLFMALSVTTLQAGASAQAAKVTVKMENATIDEMIKNVRIETNYRFLYRVEEVNKYGKRNIDLKNASIEDFLRTILSGTNLSYEIENEVIIIRPSAENKKEAEKPRTIIGKVIDTKGLPLPGSTIMLKGTKLGVVTDMDGKFKIEVPQMDSTTLIVSFIGYETQYVHVSNDPKNDAKELLIKLKDDVKQMDEVVVTGFANIKKESFTGSSISVKKEDLLKVSKTNVIKALQVFDPSFRMVENNQWGSDPNAMPEMYIRGRSGIGVKELDVDKLSKSNLSNNPNLPLFIMDGFQVSIQKVYDFDPNRIESMTILKDAAATAMYGSRAANGVVVITTIPPKPGQLNVSYTMTGTLNMPDLTDYNLMNAEEKLAAEVAGGAYSGLMRPYRSLIMQEQEYYSKLSNLVEGVDTYWLSKPLKTVFNHNHSLFVEGGHEDLRFGVNLSYASNDGVMKESFRDNMGVDISIDYRIGKLQVKNKLSYQQTKERNSPYGNFSEYTKKLPYDRAKDVYGNHVQLTEKWSPDFSNTDLMNPLWEASLGSFDKTKSDLLENELGINWYLSEYFLAKATFKLTKSTSHRYNFTDPKSYRNKKPLSITNNSSGELQLYDGEGTSWDLTANVSYNRSIAKNNINFNLGVNARSNEDQTTNAEYHGFPSGQLSSPNYAEEIYTKPTISQDKNNLIGFVGVLNYTYNNIYLFDASARFDGSSQFGSDKKWATFWSTGAGINFHNYDFMKSYDWMNMLKARVSYGLTGKINFPSSTAQTMYQIQNDEWYKTGYGATLVALGNSKLGWEKKYTTNFGLDVELFNGLISFKGDYYIEKTVDLVNDVTIPSSTGFTTYKDNLGEVEGKGFSIDLKSALVNTQDWSVNIFTNISHDKRKFVKIAESLKAYNDQVVDHFNSGNIHSGELVQPFRQFVEGGSLTPIYGMRSYGINPADGEEMLVKKNGEITYEWNASEQVALGDTEPDAQGSFGLNVRYKNWSMFTSFMFKFGGQYYNTTLVEKVENANVYKYNADKRVLSDRWQKPGDRTKYKALSKSISDIESTRPTERFVQNENVLTLNSLTLTYEFNSTWLKHAGISMMRLEAGANDLFRLSTVKAERGLSYPFARTMDITLHVSF